MSFLPQRYLYILRYLVGGELKSKYSNRLLGVLWAVLDPLLLMGVYVVMVKVVFSRGGPNYAVELLCALVTYRWFSTTVVTASRALLSNAKLIQTVKFPYAVLPLTRVLVNGVDMLVGLALLVLLAAAFGVYPTVYWLWLPLLLLLQFQFVYAASLAVSIVGVYFRDLLNLLQFVVRIGVYASPVLYSLSDLPDQYHRIYLLANPLAPLITSYKNILINAQMPSLYLLWFAVVSAALWAVAVLILRNRKNIAKDL